MDDDASRFTGDVPTYYDTMLGPILFAGYAEETARRAGARASGAVLETAAGTGRVTRALRDALPPTSTLVATDLSDTMLAIAPPGSARPRRGSSRPTPRRCPSMMRPSTWSCASSG